MEKVRQLEKLAEEKPETYVLWSQLVISALELYEFLAKVALSRLREEVIYDEEARKENLSRMFRRRREIFLGKIERREDEISAGEITNYYITTF